MLGFARAKMASKYWNTAARFGVVMVREKPAIFPATDISEQSRQATELISSAFSDPTVANETLGSCGLLNGTQYYDLQADVASADLDRARQEMGNALNNFFQN